MAYEDLKDLAKRTASDKVLRDKPFDIAKTPKYDQYQRGLPSMVYQCFHKMSVGTGVTALTIKSANNKIKQNQQLAEELHKQTIRNFRKRKAYSRFKDNIYGIDLADMQSISKFNKGTRFLLCVIDIFSKYAWLVPLKDKNDITIISAFQQILDNLIRKPNKTWVDKRSGFYNSFFKKG